MYFGGHNWTEVHFDGIYTYFRLSSIEETIMFSGSSNGYVGSSLRSRCQQCMSWFNPIELMHIFPMNVLGTSDCVWIPTRSMIDNMFSATVGNYGRRIMRYQGQNHPWWVADAFGTRGIEAYCINTDGTWWTHCISGPLYYQLGFVPHIKYKP